MQHWFEFFPNPPVVVLESISNIIKFHNIELFNKLSNVCELNEVIWKVLQSFLSKVVVFED